LQLIDVAVRREEPADVSLLIAIRVIVDAHPERLPSRQRELPFVPGLLATERRIDIRSIQLIAFAADDFDDLAAEDFVRALAEPVEQRLVDEAIALIAVDVCKRRPERVELALRKREQRTAI